MTNSGEMEKAYAGQQGECALWRARSFSRSWFFTMNSLGSMRIW